MDAKEAWEIFKTEINEAVRLHVPVRPRRQGNRPKWMNRDILKALRRKRRIWRKERYQNPSEEYKEVERKVRNLIRNAKRSYERKLARESGSNSRPFYAYLKRKTKSKTSVGPLNNMNGSLVTGDQEMAELLNEYLSSVFSREPPMPADF